MGFVINGAAAELELRHYSTYLIHSAITLAALYTLIESLFRAQKPINS